MQNKTHTRLAALGLGMTGATLLLSGCGISTSSLATATSSPIAQLQMQGNVHGGQQPVSGATIRLYATNASGYGGLSYTLLNSAVATTANGNFSITGDYTCPSSSSMVYITATGGSPSSGVSNPNLALMAALGACSTLTPATFISINELTTVASVYALAPFMTGYAAVGTSPANALGLTNAFATVNKLANITTGAIPGTALPAGSTIPSTELNTLADILASCINSSGGTAGDSSYCGRLFSYTTPPGGLSPDRYHCSGVEYCKVSEQKCCFAHQSNSDDRAVSAHAGLDD